MSRWFWLSEAPDPDPRGEDLLLRVRLTGVERREVFRGLDATGLYRRTRSRGLQLVTLFEYAWSRFEWPEDPEPEGTRLAGFWLNADDRECAESALDHAHGNLAQLATAFLHEFA